MGKVFRIGILLGLVCGLSTPWAEAAQKAEPKEEEQPKEKGFLVFESPEAAYQAFKGAVSGILQGRDAPELPAIIGPDLSKLLSPNRKDPMHYMYMNWQAYQDAFGMNYAGQNDQVEPKVSGNSATLTVNRKAFPVKLAAATVAKGWIFSPDAGAVETVRKAFMRRICQVHMQQIQQMAMQQCWQPGYTGRLPRRLDDLQVQPQFLLCPATTTHHAHPGKFKQCDYIYLGGLRYDPQRGHEQQHVLAFDRAGNHPGGRNVLFANGTLQFMDENRARAAVQKTLKDNGISLDLAGGPPPALTPEETQKYSQAVRDLASDEYVTRESASQVLAKGGESIRKLLDEGAASKDLETQERCKAILKEMDFKVQDRPWTEMVRKELGMDDAGAQPKAPPDPKAKK